jgi:uncharacterized RDD family membrane protein YckC
MFAYWTLFEGYNGQSIGKMAMNLKVTDRKGEKIDYPAAAIETIVIKTKYEEPEGIIYVREKE